MDSYSFLIGLIACVVTVRGTVMLNPLSTVYLPYQYSDNNNPMTGLGPVAAQQAAHDPHGQIVYVIGDAVMHAIDISDVNNPSIVYYENLPFSANDIDVCGDYFAVAAGADVKTQPGSVYIYSLFNPDDGAWQRLQSVKVGVLPDMLVFTEDCQTIITCDEGEPGEDGIGGVTDPEGSVTILKFTSPDLSQPPTIQTVNFTSFNDRADGYLQKGVRAPLMGQVTGLNSTFSQNMEPEYIALNEDETIAYVVLQENNAIALVDMATATITEIYELGFQNLTLNGIDASDRDSGVNIQPWMIYGMYQPDAIKYITINGDGYLAIANEGADMEVALQTETWTDSQRGKRFEESQFSNKVPSDLKAALSHDEKLGRLVLSTVDGVSVNDSSTFDEFYTFGTRSFSLIRTTDMQMIYDSGEDIERLNAHFYPTIFNMNCQNSDYTDKTPEDTMDTRSDNKGPEPESLAYGTVGTKKILFIGLERMSTIMLYQIGDDLNVTFESIHRSGALGDTFQNLYDSKTMGDYDPEDIGFIKPTDSPTGKPMLMVAGAHSGTFSLYDVTDDSVMTIYSSGDNGISPPSLYPLVVCSLLTMCY